MATGSGGTKVFVPHEELAWVPATISAVNDQVNSIGSCKALATTMASDEHSLTCPLGTKQSQSPSLPLSSCEHPPFLSVHHSFNPINELTN